MPQALHNARGGGQYNGFGKAEYRDRNQDKQEIHGNGAGETRQPHLKGRGEQSEDKTNQVITQIRKVAVQSKAVREEQASDGDCQTNEDCGLFWHWCMVQKSALLNATCQSP